MYSATVTKNRKWNKLNFIRVSGVAGRKWGKSPALVTRARMALIRKYFFNGWSLRDGLQKS